jgi:hypothetical protein
MDEELERELERAETQWVDLGFVASEGLGTMYPGADPLDAMLAWLREYRELRGWDR